MSASADLVVGVDSSTTATKAVAFDRAGQPVAVARRPHPTRRPFPGHAEQDPEDWWSGLCATLQEVAGTVGPERISALAITHQRESFALLDGGGRPLRPGILWIDERARPQVAELSRRLGADTLRAITGKQPDPTPALYAIAWLAEHEPDVLARTRAVVDVQAFLVGRLTQRGRKIGQARRRQENRTEPHAETAAAHIMRSAHAHAPAQP